MTTFTLSGTQVDYKNGNATKVKPADISVIVSSSKSTFSYTIDGRDDDGVAIIDVKDNIQQVIVGGLNLDDAGHVRSEETLITKVTWSGGTTTVLILSLETGDNTDTEYYFALDGAPLPNLKSVSAWESLDDSITNLTDPTGKFGAGKDIRWSSIDGVSSTEDDEFWGTRGRDTFKGFAGDDYFTSSNGRDTYDGGGGDYDQVAFTNDPNGVIANLKTGSATDGWGKTDTLKSIEMLRGSAHADKFTGNGKNNVFRGLEGKDTLKGGNGKDEVRYDRDERFGGTDGVKVDLAKGFAIDGFGDRDTLTSIERARGSESADELLGNGSGNRLTGLSGSDTLSGKGGNDLILGGGGNDRILGDAGNDDLFGEAGADRFIFKGNFGNDTIGDFQTAGSKEKIDLSDIGSIKHFKDLKNNHLSSNSDGDAVISDGNGNSITLDGIAAGDLSGNDFIF